VTEVYAAQELARQVRGLQIAVGRRHVRAPDVVEETEIHQPKITRQFEPQFSVGQWTGAIPPKAARLFGHTHVQRVVQWLWERLLPDTEQLVWITFSQLYLDFQLAWNHPGPLRVQGQWIDTDQRRYVAAERFTFRQRVKWFKQVVKAVWKETGTRVALAQTRPVGTMIQAFLPAASLPWPRQAVDRVDAWLADHLRGPCTKSAAALGQLPLAITKGGTRTVLR
jgi:hypothetical protein